MSRMKTGGGSCLETEATYSRETALHVGEIQGPINLGTTERVWETKRAEATRRGSRGWKKSVSHYL